MWNRRSRRQKKTIYIPIEIKVRELTSHVLLSACAIKKGFRVYLGTKVAIGDILRFKDKGGIYLYKGCRPIEYMKFISKKCDAFVILDQEIGPVIEDYEFSIPSRFRPGTLPLVDRYYTIGPLARDAAKNKLKELRGNILMTGWPRVDLWRKRYRSLYYSDAEKYKNMYGEFLLFSSDFIFVSADRIEGVFLQNMEIGIPLVQERAVEGKEQAEKIYEEFKKCVELLKIWDNDPEIPKIIVRPHPAEDILAWHSALAGLKKTICISEGDIGAWIYAAKSILHRGCTSGVQAYISEQPAAYVVIDEKRIQHNFSYRLSTPIRTTEELKEWLQSLNHHEAKDGRNEKAYNIKELNERIYIADRPASELIVDDLKTLNVTPEAPWNSKIKVKLMVKLWDLLRHLKRFMNWHRKFNKIEFNRYKIPSIAQKVPGGITGKEVEELLCKISPSLQFVVHDSGKNAVLIEAKEDG